ncbi:chemotaxis protein CheC [Anaeropeptidivorans aminofermentans]|uniref:chemotaxis protein CheC n=1 Tax=Anaeropeptidivorans aminofermentans TaxID=2934315 RepID=UPI002023E4FF|nr:chemotaxis protein CheC [Anaeropeptidivorans aminofermentans]
MSEDYDILTSMHFDVLRELGNIGSGNAVTSLAKMLDKKVDMSVPLVQFLNLSDLAGAIGGPENYVAGVLVMLSGGLNGIMMFLLEQKGAKVLINELFSNISNKDADLPLEEIELSALKELGNILTNSYLNSLSVMLNLDIKPSVPSLAIDMAGAILSVPAIEFSKVSDKVLFIDTIFKTTDTDVDGYFILVPEFDSFKIIMSNLGVL